MGKVQITTKGISKFLKAYTEEKSISEYIWNGFDAEADAINIVTKTALGNEMYCNFSIMDRNVVLYSIIFPNGIKNHDDLFMDASYYDAEENEEYTISVYDEVLFKYFSYFGIEADILNEFFYELNPECINAEIEECFKALDSSLVKEVI